MRIVRPLEWNSLNISLCFVFCECVVRENVQFMILLFSKYSTCFPQNIWPKNTRERRIFVQKWPPRIHDEMISYSLCSMESSKPINDECVQMRNINAFPTRCGVVTSLCTDDKINAREKYGSLL